MSGTIWQYYAELGAGIAERALEGIETAGDLDAARDGLRRDFLKSAGLHPLPERCDPQVTDYGEFAGEGYRARKIAWRLLPDVWATAIVFLPDPLPSEPCPAVLLACGHSSIGVHFAQAKGIMWARRGYVCLIFDTIEQHDNPGEHHGIYGFRRYDWLSLGYSASGGEMWNTLRALDVLCGLPEVDAERIGATGISGGGAHSFFAGVADDRIKAVATACGVSSVPQALTAKTILGHCDCMYVHNWWRHDLSEFAALIAPRPLLYLFAQHDALFTREEYHGLFERTRRAYALCDATDRCELFEYPGPHGDSPESLQRINAWFDEHVAGREMPHGAPGEIEHGERTTTVFNGACPMPDRLNLLPELLNPEGSYALPEGADDWPAVRGQVVGRLKREVFHTLDNSGERLEVTQVGDWTNKAAATRRRYRVAIAGLDAWIHILSPQNKANRIVVAVANCDEGLERYQMPLGSVASDAVVVQFVPRGCGDTSVPATRETELLRAGAVVGVTPALLMVHDVLLMLDWLLDQPDWRNKPVTLVGRETAAVAALYAAVLDERVAGAVLKELPPTHRHGGWLPRILHVTDIVGALGLLAPRPVAVMDSRFPTMTWPPRAYRPLDCVDRSVLVHSLREGFEHVHATNKA